MLGPNSPVQCLTRETKSCCSVSDSANTSEFCPGRPHHSHLVFKLDHVFRKKKISNGEIYLFKGPVCKIACDVWYKAAYAANK